MPPHVIIPCVSYSDRLAYTLKANQHWLQPDRTTVVTSPTDADTIALAKSYGLKVHRTDAFFADGAKMNKGAAMAEGIALAYSLGKADRVWGMDADVAMRSSTAKRLADVQMNPGVLYGLPRLILDDAETALRSLRAAPPCPAYGEHTSVIGYLQCWAAPPHHNYPSTSKTADISDVDFSRLFHEQKLYAIPGEFVLHLGKVKVDWQGRRSPIWAASKPLLAEFDRWGQS